MNMVDNSVFFPQMAPVKEAAQRSGLAVYRVRQLCSSGRVVSVRCGKKVLVNLTSLAAYLNEGDPAGQSTPSA